MNDDANLVDYEADSDCENNNARDTTIGKQDPTGNDYMDPADAITEWYREIPGDPESWNDYKCQKCPESLTSRGCEGASSGGTETAETMENLFSQYAKSLKKSATLPSQTGKDRTPINLKKPQDKGADVRGIKYLVPVDQSGASENPCLVIHERRLKALLALEEAFRGLQQQDSGPGIAQIGLMTGLDVLAKVVLL